MITHGRKSGLPANIHSVTCLSQRDHKSAAALPLLHANSDAATPVSAYQGAHYATESAGSELRLPVLLMRASALLPEEGGVPTE
jgi:hypothetical protein